MTNAVATSKPPKTQNPFRDEVQSDSVTSGKRQFQNDTVLERTPRILCIDDDPEICRTLELRLGEFQAEVLVAYFGTQGFWEAITDHPDLILMDIGMPSGDGRFVLESLRNNQTTECIPVIVLTGMRDPDLKDEMLALGANCFLNKPIHFDVLLREIREFVEIQKRPQ